MKNGAFLVTAGVSSARVTATVGHGTVNGFEPMVSGQRISKGPVITAAKNFDQYGRLYVCVRVAIDVSSGKMIVPPDDDSLTIVISPFTRLGSEANAKLESSDKKYWNHPIAVLSDTGFFCQIAHFNLMHYTSKRGVVGGAGIWYHYFCAA